MGVWVMKRKHKNRVYITLLAIAPVLHTIVLVLNLLGYCPAL